MEYDSRQEIENIKVEIASMKQVVMELSSNHIPHLEAKIDFLTERMVGRPSWVVVSMIIFLASACSVLATVLAQLLRK